MSAENETIEDIAAEIGEKSDFCHNNISTKTWEDWERMHEWLLNLRSRIEGFALRRAIELSKQFVPGNAAKLREAVVLALSLLDLKEGVPYKTVSQKDIDFMKAALAEPPRQCDVGTAEEQTTRYRTFCSAHKYLGSDLSYMCKGFGKGRCPFFNSNTKSKCELAWAQMPYNESEAPK